MDRILEHAKRLLASSNMTIKSVARQCGFRSANHICAVFRRIERKSPREFQKTRQVPDDTRATYATTIRSRDIKSALD